jgi:hypothetical protein
MLQTRSVDLISATNSIRTESIRGSALMDRRFASLLLVGMVAAWATEAVHADGPGHAVVVEGNSELNWSAAGEHHVATDDSAPAGGNPDDCDPFLAGAFSLEFMTGYYPRAPLGPHSDPVATPGEDYLPQALRLGLMLNDPHPDWCIGKGVFEALLEYDFAPIIRTFGSYFTALSGLIRYNMVRPEWAVVPYIQGGAGLCLNDAWKQPEQKLIGQEFEFLLQAEVGVHIMLCTNLSLNIEGGYQHISNADLAKRNDGLNTLGGAIGITWYFGN